MASYHLSVKTIKRSAGRSATAAAAYRSGSVIACEREGRVHDYSRKAGVGTCFILAPEGAPAWVQDRAALWNAAEARETRKNSVTAREWELALPAELDAGDREVLVREFGAALVARYGIAVDVALHEPHREGDARNHHAHVLTTTRVIGADGFGDKTRVLDAAKTGGTEIEAMRGLWADLQNRALERAGEKARVDHRALEAQRAAAAARGDDRAAEALDRPPEVKLGPAVNAMERRAQREARRDRRSYEPVTERGRAVYALRQARLALAQMRKRLGQLQNIYALARDRGQDRVTAGLAALRSAVGREASAPPMRGKESPVNVSEKLSAFLQKRQERDQIRTGLSETDQAQGGVPAPPHKERMLQMLSQITDVAARGGTPQFGDANSARAFFRDLKTSYGQDILTQISHGDDRALAADFPSAAVRQQISRAVGQLARANRSELDGPAERNRESARRPKRDEGWER